MKRGRERHEERPRIRKGLTGGQQIAIDDGAYRPYTDLLGEWMGYKRKVEGFRTHPKHGKFDRRRARDHMPEVDLSSAPEWLRDLADRWSL